jgi:toxin-antitoxin system PIN domain toxin
MRAGNAFATRSTVIAVDTNLLVYAHRSDAPFHAVARPLVESLAAASVAWAIPWPCVHEFLAIVTNARIFKTPTPIETAMAQLRTLATSVHLQFLAEGDGYLPQLERLAVGAQTRGGAIHDARIAAICLHHGVTELWSADRDFSRFPRLRTRNPLAG